MTTANGIDVSNNNGRLNLTRGFKGMSFLIAKATEGTGFVDTTYQHYRAFAKSHGLHFGAYHFMHAENGNGHNEAQWFLRHADLESGDSVWLDYETYGVNGLADANQLGAFAQTLRAMSRVKRVGLYANLTGFARVAPHNIGPTFDPLWLAYYTGKTETSDHPLARYGLSWTLHQYEVMGGIDRNYSRITANALTRMFTWLHDLDPL